MKEIIGDLLNSDAEIVCHSVNARGMMGGLAKQVMEKYPSVHERYLRICEAESDRKNLLGTSLIFKPLENEHAPYIANLFSQLNYGTETRQTSYEAFYSALEQVKAFMVKNNLHSVALPHGIACGLGGANWNIIFEMIKTVLDDSFDVRIVKLPA